MAWLGELGLGLEWLGLFERVGLPGMVGRTGMVGMVGRAELDRVFCMV